MRDRHDGELNVRAIVGFSAGLALVIAASFLLMWSLNSGLERRSRSQAPDAPPLPDLVERPEMPGPRLQTHPEAEWQQMKDEEAAELASYRLLEGRRERAQIPIDEAMRLVLRDGLPEWSAEDSQ